MNEDVKKFPSLYKVFIKQYDKFTDAVQAMPSLFEIWYLPAERHRGDGSWEYYGENMTEEYFRLEYEVMCCGEWCYTSSYDVPWETFWNPTEENLTALYYALKDEESNRRAAMEKAAEAKRKEEEEKQREFELEQLRVLKAKYEKSE